MPATQGPLVKKTIRGRPGWKQAGPGRPRGLPNIAQRHIRELAKQLTLADPIYLSNLRERLRNGTAHPALEGLILRYGYGAPPTEPFKVEVDVHSLTDTLDIRLGDLRERLEREKTYHRPRTAMLEAIEPPLVHRLIRQRMADEPAKDDRLGCAVARFA